MAHLAMLLFVFLSAVVFCSSFPLEEIKGNVSSKIQKGIGERGRVKPDEQFRKQMSSMIYKVNKYISEINEKDLLDSCEIPEDENVITTIIGTSLQTKPRFIRKGYFAAFRCIDPAAFQLLGGHESAIAKCEGKPGDRTISRYCKPLRNETEWQGEMIQLRALKLNLCNIGQQRHPFNCQRYFQCSNQYWVEQQCPSPNYFDEDLQSCQSPAAKSKSNRLCEADVKPSIIVDVAQSTWDIMGWLLVESGSNVILDCVFPLFNETSVFWQRSDQTSRNYGYNYQRITTTPRFKETSVIWSKADLNNNEKEIYGEWISDYRYRIVLNNFQYNNTGTYICKGQAYPSQHSITIALREKRCQGNYPLPDFQLHWDYYKKFPFMNHVKRKCLNSAGTIKTSDSIHGFRDVETLFD